MQSSLFLPQLHTHWLPLNCSDRMCTCVTFSRDTMPLCDICKGLFFFFYLPTLPLWWTLDFIWEFAKRKYRRHKRKKRYRAMKASQAVKQQQYFLSVDQYSRGKVERQVLDLDKKTKATRAKQAQKGESVMHKVYKVGYNEYCCMTTIHGSHTR